MMRERLTVRRTLICMAMLPVMAGCDFLSTDPDPIPQDPALVELVTGDEQSAPVGSELDLFIVRVLDGDGDPVPGVLVRFRFEQGSGNLSATGPLTETSGLASTRLTLPLVPGEIVVSAAVGQLAPVLFHAEAVEVEDSGS